MGIASLIRPSTSPPWSLYVHIPIELLLRENNDNRVSVSLLSAMRIPVSGFNNWEEKILVLLVFMFFWSRDKLLYVRKVLTFSILSHILINCNKRKTGEEIKILFPLPPPTHVYTTHHTQAYLKNEGVKGNPTDAGHTSAKKAHPDSHSYSSLFLNPQRQVHTGKVFSFRKRSPGHIWSQGSQKDQATLPWSRRHVGGGKWNDTLKHWARRKSQSKQHPY